MATIASNLSTSSSSNDIYAFIGTARSYAQTFKANISATIGSVWVRLGHYGGDSYDFVIAIRNTVGGVPVEGLGSDLWSQEFSTASLSSSSTLVEFTGVNVPVVDGTTYAIVIRQKVMGVNQFSQDLRWFRASYNSEPNAAPYTSLSNDTTSWTPRNPVNDQTFHITSAVVLPSTPELELPSDGAQNQSINTDHYKQFIWDDDDDESLSAYTVHFSIDDGFSFIPRNDRSRYSIIFHSFWLDLSLEYSTTYYWFVRKDVEGEITDSDVWSFTTLDYEPPALKTRQKLVYGTEGNPQYETVPTGENNMMSINRLIVAGDNSIFYEDV
jgi:hypothetical protein